MVYVYPAIFKKLEDGYFIKFPDLDGCMTEGDDLSDAIYMARDALSLWLMVAEDEKEKLPIPSTTKTELGKDEFITMIDTDVDAYRRVHDNKVVKKTLTIPSWLNERALEKNINFSQTLQEALKEKIIN